MVLKRKISAHAVCIDQKKTNGPKKPLTKAEIQEDLKMTKSNLKMTKELNDALLEEVKENEAKLEALEKRNKKNDNIISLLEERVKYLENKTNKSEETEAKKTVDVEKNSIESQTESEYQDYHCQNCIYVASCIDELDWHIENAHADEEPFDVDSQKPYSCNICAKKECKQGSIDESYKNYTPRNSKNL